MGQNGDFGLIANQLIGRACLRREGGICVVSPSECQWCVNARDWSDQRSRPCQIGIREYLDAMPCPTNSNQALDGHWKEPLQKRATE
jgi:hypothetical protein